MAKLCNGCKNKAFDQSVRGTCQAVNMLPAANLPDGHMPWTDGPKLILCDACCDHFKQCAMCFGPIDGYGRNFTPTDKQFVRVFPNQNGIHITGMNIGEQVLCQMQVDLYTGMGWVPSAWSNGIRLAQSRLVVDGGRYGTLELYFDLEEANPKALIVLQEGYIFQRWWSPSIPNPKGWMCTVEIRR
jgi:hypothetical protein